jgi:hypothetical protein
MLFVPLLIDFSLNGTCQLSGVLVERQPEQRQCKWKMKFAAVATFTFRIHVS